MSYRECKVAIDFSRHHLTHLDPCVFRDGHVPLELFVDYEAWIRPLARDVRALRDLNELRKPEEWRGIPAKTHWSRPGGGTEQVEVEVLDFDPTGGRFFVKNATLGLEAWRTRLYL